MEKHFLEPESSKLFYLLLHCFDFSANHGSQKKKKKTHNMTGEFI